VTTKTDIRVSAMQHRRRAYRILHRISLTVFFLLAVLPCQATVARTAVASPSFLVMSDFDEMVSERREKERRLGVAARPSLAEVERILGPITAPRADPRGAVREVREVRKSRSPVPGSPLAR
jgi:hypothetical protein